MKTQQFIAKSSSPRTTLATKPRRRSWTWKQLACVVTFLWMQAAAQSLWAESRIEVIGATPRSCKKQINKLQSTLHRLPIANNWRFVIVCTPAAWEGIAGPTDATGKTATAFTNLEGRYTFFNGANISPRVVAHEF